MRLTKATLKRLIKEELDAMQGGPSEDDFGIAQEVVRILEQEAYGFSAIGASELDDDTLASGEQYRKAAEYVRSTLLPTLEMMAEDPERYMDRGMMQEASRGEVQAMTQDYVSRI